MKVLVTGGAGYIGSHTVKMLCEHGHEVLTVDDLSSGHRDALLCGGLVIGDVGDENLMREVFSYFKADVVIHFAGYIVVSESFKEPLKYFKNNLSSTVNLLRAMELSGVDKFVFSSSAAVYGIPEKVPVDEFSPTSPISPYGKSKLMVEQILKEIAPNIKSVSLRYFNAAGADESALIGEAHKPETHLIPLLLKTAKGERRVFRIFGTNYPTKDGTCVRDFIHVNDLAAAHLLALEWLADGGEFEVFNCGYGHGFSVLEVVDAAKKITGVDIPVVFDEPREGDPPVLVAATQKIKKKLYFEPKFDDLDYIIETAWKWELNRRF